MSMRDDLKAPCDLIKIFVADDQSYEKKVCFTT